MPMWMLSSLCHLSRQCFGVMITVWSNRRTLVVPNEGWSMHNIRPLSSVWRHSHCTVLYWPEKPFWNAYLQLTFMFLYLDSSICCNFVYPNRSLPAIYLFIFCWHTRCTCTSQYLPTLHPGPVSIAACDATIESIFPYWRWDCLIITCYSSTDPASTLHVTHVAYYQCLPIHSHNNKYY